MNRHWLATLVQGISPRVIMRDTVFSAIFRYDATSDSVMISLSAESLIKVPQVYYSPMASAVNVTLASRMDSPSNTIQARIRCPSSTWGSHKLSSAHIWCQGSSVSDSQNGSASSQAVSVPDHEDAVNTRTSRE